MAARPARAVKKSREAFRTISEVAAELDLPQHVLRFWETRFSQVRPMKRGGNRRYYRPADIELLRTIHHLLYTDGYTIKGVQKLFREQGARRTVDEVLAGKSAAIADATPTAGEADAATKSVPSGPDVEASGSGARSLDIKSLIGELMELRDLLRRAPNKGS